MNRIEAKQIISFDRHILSIFIDGNSLTEHLSKQTGDSLYKDLWCAWLLTADESEGRYIWALTDDKQNCNLPILICPDDMDLWCTVIVAQVKFYDKTVAWERLGLVKGKFDVKQWRESGIQKIEKWSNTDWEMYGATLSGLDVNDKAWEIWWSEHWADEEMRRLWNYFHDLFNDDNNIEWLNCEKFEFLISDYDSCVFEFNQYDWDAWNV